MLCAQITYRTDVNTDQALVFTLFVCAHAHGMQCQLMCNERYMAKGMTPVVFHDLASLQV